MKIGILKNPVNSVRNSGRCDSKPSGPLNPALGRDRGRQAVGMILKSNPVAEQRGLFLTG